MDSHTSEVATGRPSPFTDPDAALLSMQSFVGRKWQPVVVYHLLREGALGFSALKECVDGVSSKMLSETLDELEATGLVSRTVVSDQPVRVEYALTERGETLEPLVGELLAWGSEHGATGEEGLAVARR